MAHHSFKENLQAELEALSASGMERSLRCIDKNRYSAVLSSNDYLGIASDAGLLDEFYAQRPSGGYGQGAASSRLLTGNSNLYTQLENWLAAAYGREAALVFNSGYHANIGILPALASKGDLVLSDKLNHASIIDGLRLCDAEWLRYRHADYGHLERILQEKRSRYKNCFIVTESVFSMDGDCADLPRLIDIKSRYGCLLYVDEAHAAGTRGHTGMGLCQEQGTIPGIDFIVGTFGKAWAGQGAYLVADSIYCRYLTNKMRSLIFTTAMPPASISWLLFIAPKIAEMGSRRASLEQVSAFLRHKLRAIGMGSSSASNIIPIPMPGPAEAMAAAAELETKGLLAMAVRPPTVPPGGSRLRLSVCCGTDTESLQPLWDILE
jgi:8-amino-7-oxononanoate synthase